MILLGVSAPVASEAGAVRSAAAAKRARKVGVQAATSKPVFAGSIGDQVFTVGSSASLTPPSVTGGDGALRYRLSPAAPPGLSLDASTGVLSGAPTASQAAEDYVLTVGDGDSDTAPSDEDSLTFAIGIRPAKPPTPAVANWTASYVDLTVSAPSDPNFLSYGVEMRPSGGAWATVSASSTRSGSLVTLRILGLTDGATYDFRVRARGSKSRSNPITPGDRIESEPSAAVTVTLTDLEPDFGSASVPPQMWGVDKEITPFTIPEASSGNGWVRHEISGLPAGVEMSRTTRRVSGTPEDSSLGNGTATVTATDEDGDQARLTFGWTVGIWQVEDGDLPLYTNYGASSEFALAEYLVAAAAGTGFALKGCDADYLDYYDSVTVGAAGSADAGKLLVDANTRGHVHTSTGRTICTVTATHGDASEDQAFELYISSARRPAPMFAPSVQGVTASSVTVRLASGSYPYVRLGIREPGGSYQYYVVRSVDSGADFTFTGLTPATTYEIQAAQMNRQSFHLWGGADDDAAGTLVAGTAPSSGWSSRLSNGGIGAPQPPVSARTPDAPVVTLSLSSTSIAEDGGVTTVTAALDKASTAPTTILVSATPAAPGMPGDIRLSSNRTLTIAAGTTSSTGVVTVTAVDNPVDAPDTTVTVSGAATNPDGVGSPAPVDLTIVDDDAPPAGIALSLSPSRISEIAGQQPVQVTARLLGGATLPRPTSVTLSVNGGTATQGTDFMATTPAMLMIPARESSGAVMFEVTVMEDTEDEEDEMVEVSGDASLDVTSAMLTIEDYRPAGTGGGGGGGGVGADAASDGSLELRPQNARAREDSGAMEFTVPLSAVSGSPVSVLWQTEDRTAIAGADYQAARGVLTIPAGETSGTLRVPLLDDRLDESDETLAVRFSAPDGAALASDEATGTILDDDAPPALLVGDASASEADGALGFPVWLASDSGRTVRVDYRTKPGSAAPGLDYRHTAGTLSIPPGSAGVAIRIEVLNDELHEADETVELVLENPRFAVAGDLLATGIIRDDDAEPGVLIPDATASERSGVLEFAATLAAVAGRELRWEFETSDGTATAGADYQARRGVLIFEPGTTRALVPITLLDDLLDEAEEDFRLRVTNPREPAQVVEGTGVIVDDDDNAIVADAWISRFGRTVATQVVDAVSGRFAAMGGPDSHFLPGMDLFGDLGRAGAAEYRGLGPPWMAARKDGPAAASLDFDPARFLDGMSFQHQGAPEGWREARWTTWGRGSYMEFDGLDPGVGVSGEVLNLTAGFDVQTGALTSGAAFAGSAGTGTFEVARTEDQSERTGTISSTLGSAHPYVHLGVAEWLQLWGLGGIGTGSLRISGAEEDAGLFLTMWAVGGRSELPPVPGRDLTFALKSDAFWVYTKSDATDVRRTSSTKASRMRLMLESSFRLVSVWGGELTPLVEAGFRRDGGDAETGRGLEVASGLRYANSERGLFLEMTGRSLVAHEDENYREWGLGGSLRLEPPDSRGLALRVNSSPGAAASTVHGLWSETGAVSHFARPLLGRHEAEVGYGLATRGGATLMPFSAFVYAPGGTRGVRLGGRMRTVSGWTLSLSGSRSESPHYGASYGVLLRGSLLSGKRSR